jgi:hypothetical protein
MGDGVVVHEVLPTGYPPARRTGDLAWGRKPDERRPHREESAVPVSAPNRRPLPLSLEVVNRAAPETRKPRCSAVCEALCRTRTGDPFLTIESQLSNRVPPRLYTVDWKGPDRPGETRMDTVAAPRTPPGSGSRVPVPSLRGQAPRRAIGRVLRRVRVVDRDRDDSAFSIRPSDACMMAPSADIIDPRTSTAVRAYGHGVGAA